MCSWPFWSTSQTVWSILETKDMQDKKLEREMVRLDKRISELEVALVAAVMNMMI